MIPPPKLTKRVIKGLRNCRSLIAIHLESGPDGSDWTGTLSAAELANTELALAYLDALLRPYP